MNSGFVAALIAAAALFAVFTPEAEAKCNKLNIIPDNWISFIHEGALPGGGEGPHACNFLMTKPRKGVLTLRSESYCVSRTTGLQTDLGGSIAMRKCRVVKRKPYCLLMPNGRGGVTCEFTTGKVRRRQDGTVRMILKTASGFKINIGGF